MQALVMSLVVVVTAAFLATGPAFAAEYFVVKSRSGILRIVDHKPQGGGTIVKGPFKSAQEAEKAMQSATDTKATRGDGK